MSAPHIRSRTTSRGRRGATLTVTVAAAVAALLTLSGCVPSLLAQEKPVSTPTGEQVAPELEPFYSQVLEWDGCGEGMTCATAKAPLDWSDPGAGEIELALSRHSATGDKVGSLLLNPGGPGGSGYDFVIDSLDFAVGEPLKQRFDVVGFDPRGVNRSTAVACYDAAAMDEFLFGVDPAERGSDEWIENRGAANAAFGEACLDETGDLLANVDTESAARDLDLLRAVLGDDELNYLGFSYGTFLGATYAELYPDKVGRLVLDGALDPTASTFDVNKAQAVGFEGALEAYLENCLAGDECPFSGTVDDSVDEIGRLLASVDVSPLRGSDGRMVDGDTLFTAIIYPLYSPESWPFLSEMLAATMFGDGDAALSFADGYHGRDADGTYLDNSTEAFRSINCLDYPTQVDVEVMREEAAEIAAAAPTFGPYMSYDDLTCNGWPHESTREPAEIHAEGAAPIMVVGTTGDPATPYEWSVALADQLESGVLVTYEGEGHTAYNKSNACVSDAVESYLIDGTVPSSDPKC
ncbi:alpha/beta hydrolase [Agromyces sp. SYSU K20354]|uniref:alpha/beta hydrolase n=1 Tax=Agromyces cavernae TaxID=2898659 RepID=UPI001E5AB840|nr:alpha/beta hydrolase [Agromyces cavernae]MCD2444200.1 alpha/beta hydrolase [Agromyces cavernae]